MAPLTRRAPRGSCRPRGRTSCSRGSFPSSPGWRCRSSYRGRVVGGRGERDRGILRLGVGRGGRTGVHRSERPGRPWWRCRSPRSWRWRPAPFRRAPWRPARSSPTCLTSISWRSGPEPSPRARGGPTRSLLALAVFAGLERPPPLDMAPRAPRATPPTPMPTPTRIPAWAVEAKVKGEDEGGGEGEQLGHNVLRRCVAPGSGCHGADSDLKAIMPLFRPKQDKNLRLPRPRNGG